MLFYRDSISCCLIWGFYILILMLSFTLFSTSTLIVISALLYSSFFLSSLINYHIQSFILLIIPYISLCSLLLFSMPRKRKFSSQDEYRIENNRRRRERYAAEIIRRQQHATQMATKNTQSIPLHAPHAVIVTDVSSVPISSEDEDHLIDVPIYTNASEATSSLHHQSLDALLPSSSFVPSSTLCFPFRAAQIPHIVNSLSASAISQIDPCIYFLLHSFV